MDLPDSGLALDVSTRREAAAVLQDLVQWRLTDQRWGQVYEVLQAMAAAASASDIQGVLAATSELEVLSPVRVARLGTTPVGLAPQPVRLLRNKLVHDLGIEDAIAPDAVDEDALDEQAWARTPSAVAVPTAPVAGFVTHQELVIHHFAALDGPHTDRAYEQLRLLWERCRDRFGTTEPVPNLGLPTDLPANLMTVPATPVIAAVQNTGVSVQAILRRDHDVLNLSVLCAGEPGQASAGWAALDHEWDSVAATTTGALLGVARLYLGLASRSAAPLAATAELAAAYAPDLPPGTAERFGAGVAVAGCAVWELQPGHTRPERRLVVLAEADSDDALSAWAWSRGDPALTPFTQYLLHAAKVRYEARIHERSTVAVPASDHDADPGRLTQTITRLRDMQTTTNLARRNMAALLGPTDRAGFVADDDSLAEWLTSQLDADISYLTNERERATGGVTGGRTRGMHRNPTRAQARRSTHTFGLVTALPEEFAAMRALIDIPTEQPIDGDRAHYVVGTMPSADPETPHRVTLTLLGETANPAAAAAVAQMLRSFTSINQVIMVGIAAGIPAPGQPDRHVRLGDIVAATWGIIPYDHIIDTPQGPELRQVFPRPSALLTHRAKMLEADELLGHRPWETLLDTMTSTFPAFDRPAAETDRLFASDDEDADEIAHPDPTRSGHRPGRPKVHYGRIGSADTSMRNTTSRDQVAARYAVRAIEMEGRGVGTAAFASGREWFVLRGISDYADSRVNRVWRPYAAAVAAAYVAALLAQCPSIDPHGGHTHGAGGA